MLLNANPTVPHILSLYQHPSHYRTAMLLKANPPPPPLPPRALLAARGLAALPHLLDHSHGGRGGGEWLHAHGRSLHQERARAVRHWSVNQSNVYMFIAVY
jgi:hypothetical protein